MKVQDYLETNIIHLHHSIFACTNFCQCKGLDILYGFIFANESDFTSKYSGKSGTIFWFCILCIIYFCKKSKNLKNCKISCMQNCVTWKNKGRISTLSRGDAFSTPELVSKAAFACTLKFWNPLNTPHHKDLPPTWKEWVPSHRGGPAPQYWWPCGKTWIYF